MAGANGKSLNPEDMPVYQDALRLLEISEREAARIERRWPDLAYHIRRSATSVVLNTREGATEFEPKEKIRFYRYGKRESGELIGAFEGIQRLKAGTDETAEGRRIAISIVGQLTALIHAARTRARKA